MEKANFAVLVDFGSTYTKMVLVDLRAGRHIKSDHYPSTVAADAAIALNQCLESARQVIGQNELDNALKLATSSAAGGLRMGVVGLSKTLSLEAGKSAAFGAGAKILKTVSGRIKTADIDELTALPLEILLLTGGYEKGSTEAVLHNAGMLSESALSVPIIYAGNSEVSCEVRSLFIKHGKECYLASNIIPQVGMLEKAEAEEIIRDIFLKRIINMKGLARVSSMLDRFVMPTPKSVLSAGELLAKGTANREGLGDLIIVDIGGATTDIHSYAGHTTYQGAKIVGTHEPYSKRTVEGDLGLNESKPSLIHEAGLDGAEVTDEELAFHAARIAARRHAGTLEHGIGIGEKLLQKGKDLTHVKTVIGTGGPIIYNSKPYDVLKGVMRESTEKDLLLPESSDLFIDSNYLLFAGGLLREIDENIAFDIMLDSLKRI